MADETQDENLKDADSSAASEGVDTTESPAVEGAVAKDSPAATQAESRKTEKSQRESLIKQLTGEDKEETSSTPDADEADGAEEIEGDVLDTEDDEVGDPATAVEQSKKTGTDKPSEDDEKPPEGIKGKAAKRWEAILTERKALKQKLAEADGHAKFGRQVGEFAAGAGMDSATFGAWLALGAEVNADPAKMPGRLFAEAKRLAKAMKVELPVEKSVESPLDLQALEEKLVDDITEMNLPADVGKRYLALVRDARKKLVAPVAKPEEKEEAPTLKAVLPVPNRQVSEQPAQTQVQQEAVRTADAEIKKLDLEYAARYGKAWIEKIRPVVQAEMKKYKGTDPANWPKFLKTEVAGALQKTGLAKKATPPVVSTTLRPTTSPTKQQQKQTARAGILKELTGS